MSVSKILRTKITPPRRSTRILPRQRVTHALLEALNYRLTLLQAGAGYGKSTALAVLAEELQPLIWYQVNEEDADPLIFLLHLCHATLLAFPDMADLPLPLLEASDGSQGPLATTEVIDQYMNALSEHLEGPTLLILDDIHLALHRSEISLLLDRLVGLAPDRFHLLLAGRPPLKLPNLARWRGQGEVLALDQGVLIFNANEVAALFAQYYDYELTADEIQVLLENTEGWAIALQLIWQSLRSGASTSIENSLTHQERSPDSLFDILAREVFQGQPQDIQEFLLVSATLREMTPEACQALLSPASAPYYNEWIGSSLNRTAAMLGYLREQELFVIDQGDGSLRYHNIFHQFLRQQASPEQHRQWHTLAAAYYTSRQDSNTAIYHLLQAPDREGAADLLEDYSAQLLAAGRLDTLAAYLEDLPPDTLRQHPALLYALGDLARLHSRFEEALGWYGQAESVWRERGQLDGLGRALRGQARVYLDTVNPSRAEELLQQATRLSDGMDDRESRARLYELLAENKLNAGRVQEAEALRRQADTLRSEGPSDSQLVFRVLLRTGRLEEARLGLEARLEAERHAPVHTPRAHRETLLLLSLIYAFLGQPEKAYGAALEGTQRGVELQSPFVTAVGYTRQGHAMLLSAPGPAPFAGWYEDWREEHTQADRFVQAREQFEKTVGMSQTLSVARLRVEAYWGLCRVYGYQGDLPQALRYAREGGEIAAQAGDEWIASLLRLAMGASLTLAARSESSLHAESADEWLSAAGRGFQECSDTFGRCAARLWQCLNWFQQTTSTLSASRDSRPGRKSAFLSGINFHPRLAQILPEALATCRQNGYDFFFTRPSLAGPPDERIWVPLLLFARQEGWEGQYISRLLDAMGLPQVSIHPGYGLRIQTLGAFHAKRGRIPITPNQWRREKARELFQLLLTLRHTPPERDQICEALWPGLDPFSAQRNFKVTLNTLFGALEPNRVPGQESAYIVREDSRYGLRAGADLWLDAEAFLTWARLGESLLETQPDQALVWMQRAIALYQGEYLPDSRYETWAAAEREYLTVQFFRTADRLSELLLQNGRNEEAIAICQRILSYDNCWERAYRSLMVAFDRLGDHGQLARTYQRCRQTLMAELEVGPAPETEALFHKLAHSLPFSAPLP